MKKRLFLLLCGVVCLFLMLCSCNDTENEHDHDHSSVPSQGASSSIGSSLVPSIDSSDNGTGKDDALDNEISPPETPCEFNSLGHYWSNVKINKNTSATGTVAISGECNLCGDSLYKVCTALVDYNEWKSALCEDGLSSFTTVSGNEYTDYDKNGSLKWRIDENKTYTADYFINSSEKSSSAVIQNFKGFLLQYNSFKYDSVSKTYVYWINENSYIELGFANGQLLSHSTCTKNGDREEKTTTLYLNQQRVDVEIPGFIVNKFSDAVTLKKLNSSTVGSTLAEKIYNELTSLSFNGTFEASLLKNDEVSIYFYLDKPGKNPVSGEDYNTASVVIKDFMLTKVSFGSTTLEIEYK